AGAPSDGERVRALAAVTSEPRTLPNLVRPFAHWLRFVRERADNTVRAYEATLRVFVEFCADGGLTEPQAVTRRHIELYLAWLRQTRSSTGATANRHLHALRTFWTYLLREDIATRN